jgi:single-stranded DNA-binding protein
MHSITIAGKAKKVEQKGNIVKFSICEKAYTKQGDPDKFTWFNLVAFGKTAEWLDGLQEGQQVAVIAEYSLSEYEGKKYPQFTVRSASYEKVTNLGGGQSQTNSNSQSQGKEEFIEDDIPF